MNKLKVMTVVGTRPEIIRLARVMAVLDRETDHTIVHTGQNYDYELNQIFFDDLGIRSPDRFLNAAGKTPAETCGLVIAKTDEVLAELQPEAMLILGDTNSCLAAYAAKRRKVPVFHMEAGNRCFDQRVPEEINRKVVDHISDINLPYSSIAREYLLREGLPPDRVIKTGSPMFEVLNFYREKIMASNVLADLGLTEAGYFVISAHREENIEPNHKFQALISMLNWLGEEKGMPVIVSTHPRTRKKLDGSGLTVHSNVQFLKPLGFSDYNRLQVSSKATLSDSGTISEESSILNFPALNLRDAHERPEAFEEASVMMVGFNVERVAQALAILDGQPRGEDRILRPVGDYSMPNVSEKVVRIIHSYVDYIHSTVYRRA